MKVTVLGLTDDARYAILEKAMEEVTKQYGKIEQVIVSNTPGYTYLAKRWAAENGIDWVMYGANHVKFGDSATEIRNRNMIDAADLLVLIWRDKGPQLIKARDYVLEVGKELYVVIPRVSPGNEKFSGYRTYVEAAHDMHPETPGTHNLRDPRKLLAVGSIVYLTMKDQIKKKMLEVRKTNMEDWNFGAPPEVLEIPIGTEGVVEEIDKRSNGVFFTVNFGGTVLYNMKSKYLTKNKPNDDNI